MPITWEVIAAFITVFTAIAGVWWRVEGMIRKNTDDLADHRLHIAENFVTKQGLKEQTDAMLLALNGIRDDLKSLNGRIDRMLEARPSSTRRTGA